MSALPSDSVSQRSAILRGLRWLISARGIRRLLILFAWVATLVVLFYAEENWRGASSWKAYSRNFVKQGESLDFYSYIPKPIPAAENFASTPFVASWFTRSTNGFVDPFNDRYKVASKLVGSGHTREEHAQRHFLDLEAWSSAFDTAQSGTPPPGTLFHPQDRSPEARAKAAPSVLSALEDDAPWIEELRKASSRPGSVYAVNYAEENPWAILLPHLARIKDVCLRLELKASAELAAGNPAAAFQDLKLILFMADSLREEPILVSGLVRLAIWQIGTHVVWEGLSGHIWSDEQLKELQELLLKCDFLGDLATPLRAERAASLYTVDYIRKTGNLSGLGASGSAPDGLVRWLCHLAPAGWYNFEKVNYCRFADLSLRGGYDPVSSRLSPGRLEANAEEIHEALFTRGWAPLSHVIAARLLLPDFRGMLRKYAAAQTDVNQTAIACAIERSRLSEKRLPESLESLQPKYISRIPQDLLSGGTYKFQLADGGNSFLLYSIGWNDKDDLGVPGRTLFDEKEGDWVWR